MSDLDPINRLPEGYLHELVNEFTDSETVGFLLTGSYARGDAGPFSDVDLMKFVRRLPQAPSRRDLVRLVNERLVSVKVATVTEKLDELARPEKAIWAVPGLRQAIVLSDENEQLYALKHRAESFEWASLQPAAEAYASNEVAGYAEEVHKLLNASTGSDSAAEYAILGLLLGLTRVVAVKLGIMIESENVYFGMVRKAMGDRSNWSLQHKRITEGGRLADRISAALLLYLATADLIDDVSSRGDDLNVVIGTKRQIKDLLAEN
jgi:hypothetical protein